MLLKRRPNSNSTILDRYREQLLLAQIESLRAFAGKALTTFDAGFAATFTSLPNITLVPACQDLLPATESLQGHLIAAGGTSVKGQAEKSQEAPWSPSVGAPGPAVTSGRASRKRP